MDNTEILIVGANPTGLTLALALARQGINCRIIDAKDTNFIAPSILFNARTLEIWKTLGVEKEIIAAGTKLEKIALLSDNKELNHAFFKESDSEFNFILSLPQNQLEELLIKSLNNVNLFVEWNTHITQLVSNEQIVEITCHNQQYGNHNFTAKWVIICDDKQQNIKQLLNFKQSSTQLSHRFILVDGLLDGYIDKKAVSIIFHPSGNLIFIPMRDTVRVLIEIHEDNEYKDVTSFSQDTLNAIFQERVPYIQLNQVDVVENFYLHGKLVDNFVQQQIILVGEAGHSYAPMGWYGMNTSIQDSWNISWKVAQVIKNQANNNLITTYNIERRGLAVDLMKRSESLIKLGNVNNKIMQLFRNLGVEGALSIELIRKKIISGLAQTDIHYTNSPLIDNDQVLYQNKLRYMNNVISWKLLSKDKIIESALPNFVKIEHHSIPWSDQPLCLIRPDGYIAMYADSLFEISSYFVEHNIHD
jgi:2-polyprenyl-6-methoxyphenol hydroxylase-like FAD-dependent oxidoreductase